MANAVFNVALGRINELHDRVVGNDPANSALVIVLLKTAEADATLKDYTTLAALLAGANVEANFTNYARKVLTNTELTGSTADQAAKLLEYGGIMPLTHSPTSPSSTCGAAAYPLCTCPAPRVA